MPQIQLHPVPWAIVATMIAFPVTEGVYRLTADHRLALRSPGSKEALVIELSKQNVEKREPMESIMENDNDVDVLQAQIRALSKRLEVAESASTNLQNHLIRQSIRKNTVFKTRVLDYDGLAEKLSSSFKVEFIGGIPRVVARDKVVSLRHGYTNDPNVAIPELLETKFREFLLPELPATNATPGQGDKVADKKPDDGVLKQLKDAHQAARERGDGARMVSLKRQLAQAGYATAIL